MSLRVPAEIRRSFAGAQDDSSSWGHRGGKKRRFDEIFKNDNKIGFRIASSFPPVYTQHRVILSASEGSPKLLMD